MSDQKKEIIAGLIAQLPMFMGILLEGGNFRTSAGLNMSEEKTLMYIHRHEGGTMTDYSKRVGLARGSFTAVADSLEEKGLVGRVSGPDDRRKYGLVLTEEGKKAAREINSRFRQHVAARLAPLTEQDLNSLEKALETIAAMAEKLRNRGNR